MVYIGFILLGTYQCLENWFGAKEKIQKHFQVCICPSCVCLVFFLRKPTEFHEMRTECQRKLILIHFLLYSLFWSPPDHSRPNFLARQSLALQSLAPQSLTPERSTTLTRILGCVNVLWHEVVEYPPHPEAIAKDTEKPKRDRRTASAVSSWVFFHLYDPY